MKNIIDPCIMGSGVICGAEVHVNTDCSVEIGAGSFIFPSGRILHFPGKKFRYYKLHEHTDEKIKSAIPKFLKAANPSEPSSDFFELTDDTSDTSTIDSLKPQHPEDETEHDFLMDKIVALYLQENDAPNHSSLFFLLLSREAIAISKDIKPTSNTGSQGIFSKAIKRKQIDLLTIDRFLRPELTLPPLNIRRFGYKELAILNKAHGLKENNLQAPFTGITSFKAIFFEYKAIIEEEIETIQNALKEMHLHFGGFFTHKGSSYLEKYRRVLMVKWQRFCEEGEHLYYIQYFYDWLCDLAKAYNELAAKLDGFSICHSCLPSTEEGEETGNILLLGPVLGGRSTYHPLIFRDLARPSLTDENIRELRCLHWRMMMMIWTFDLPFLHLDKVLYNFGFDPGVEEKLDSTNYWEGWGNDGDQTTNFHNLPVKITPTQAPESEIGWQAIPYYYPLDSNSAYSLHQFWDYHATKMRLSDRHLSYNAYFGDPDKPTMDIANDSYTNYTEVIMPLAYSLRNQRFLKVEGHIGKSIITWDGAFIIENFPLLEYIQQYNLCLDVIAIGLSADSTEFNLEKLTGLEHGPSLQPGNTLVLLFNRSNEKLELQECKKEYPEIAKNTIVADFVLPYRWTCCKLSVTGIFILSDDQRSYT